MYTGADAVMINRAAQGHRIFGKLPTFWPRANAAPPLVAEVKRLLLDHLEDHYALYGEFMGRCGRSQTHWLVCEVIAGRSSVSGRMNPD